MEKTHEAPLDPKVPDPAVDRKPYQRPVLRHYGDVHFLTRGASSTGTGDGAAMMIMPSDRSVKKNLTRIGDHPLGIGLYLFEYTTDFRDAYGRGRQFGVIADEVEAAMPAAVSVAPRGHKQVDYAMLGITRPAR